MKTTKTGLHIQTRKNRIEVYTQKELEQVKKKTVREARAYIISMAISFINCLTNFCIRFYYLEHLTNELT